MLVRIAAKLHEEYPDVHYHIYSGDSDDITDKLDKGLFDFGVFVEPADVSKYEYIRLPAVDRWGILMRADSPLAAKEYIEPKDLCSLPLIMSRQSLTSRDIPKWIGCDFDDLNIIATYNLLYNASLMADEGLGYVLCLDKIIRTNEKKTLTFRPLKSEMSVHLDIVWKKHQVFSQAAELFLKRLQEQFNEKNRRCDCAKISVFTKPPRLGGMT